MRRSATTTVRRLIGVTLLAVVLTLTGLAVGFGATAASAVDPGDSWPPTLPGAVETDGGEFASALPGYWSGDWGTILFRVDGINVTAAYPHDQGLLVGVIHGAVLDAWWCELPTQKAPQDAGPVQMRLVDGPADTRTLDGRWAYASDATGTWVESWDVGSRADESAAPAALVDAIDTAEAQCDPPFAFPAAAPPFTADQPSVLSSLITVQEVRPAAVVTAAAVSVVLIAVATYPGVLLDGTLSADYDRIFGWATPLRRRVDAVVARVRRRIPGWLPIAIGIALALVIAGFVEPRFGVNGGSVRLLISLTISILVERVIFFVATRRLLERRHPGDHPVIRFAAGSLLLVAIAVLLTRFTGFEPGIVFGLLLGLSFAVDIGRAREGRLALAASGYAFGIGILGWLIYSALTALLGAHPGIFGLFAVETFSGFAVSGLAALPIALLPIAVLDGGAVLAWRRVVWAISYVVALTAFLVVILPLPTSWGGVGDYAGWIAIYVGYCVVAVGVWAIFRFGRRRRESADSGQDGGGQSEGLGESERAGGLVEP